MPRGQIEALRVNSCVPFSETGRRVAQSLSFQLRKRVSHFIPEFSHGIGLHNGNTTKDQNQGLSEVVAGQMNSNLSDNRAIKVQH